MSLIRLTKEFSFEMAHTLAGYDGACREIHGHSYRLFVTVRGVPSDDPDDPKYGMVMDFGDLKRIVGRSIVDRYDHCLLMRRTPENELLAEALHMQFDKVELVDYQPTCENLAALFARTIGTQLPDGIELYKIRLHETATSFAEWLAADNPGA